LYRATVVQIKLAVTTNAANTAHICIIYSAELYSTHTVVIRTLEAIYDKVSGSYRKTNKNW